MDDQNHSPKPIVLPTPPTPAREILHSETFEVVSKPIPAEIVNTMARMAKFLNYYIVENLRSQVVSAANPASVALFNSAAALEQGAMQLHQLIVQQQQHQFAGPGQGMPPGMGPQGPYRN